MKNPLEYFRQEMASLGYELTSIEEGNKPPKGVLMSIPSTRAKPNYKHSLENEIQTVNQSLIIRLVQQVWWTPRMKKESAKAGYGVMFEGKCQDYFAVVFSLVGEDAYPVLLTQNPADVLNNLDPLRGPEDRERFREEALKLVAGGVIPDEEPRDTKETLDALINQFHELYQSFGV